MALASAMKGLLVVSAKHHRSAVMQPMRLAGSLRTPRPSCSSGGEE